jgi:hypothetical protein
VLLLPPAVHGAAGSGPTLDVTFSPTGTITVTLPDGTPVGSTSGAPTTIPAGYYTLLMSGPGGCTQLPLFELKGPGEDLFENMTEGEVDYTSDNAFLMPNSTYVWRNYAAPSVAHTLVTSGTVEGAPPRPASSVSSGTVSSQDIVGSDLAPFRGTLTAAVSAAGKLTLAFKGRSIEKLSHGRYTVKVTDRSASSGLTIEKGKKVDHATGATFVGARSASLVLSAGRWTFTAGTGGYRIAVS